MVNALRIAVLICFGVYCCFVVWGPSQSISDKVLCTAFFLIVTASLWYRAIYSHRAFPAGLMGLFGAFLFIGAWLDSGLAAKRTKEAAIFFALVVALGVVRFFLPDSDNED